MTRTVYIDGEFKPENEARVSIFDRGFLFGDAVYEVTAVLEGKLTDFDGHFGRLGRSLGELNLVNPFTRNQLLNLQRELVRVNSLKEGIVYLQVSRGVADRDFLIPEVEPSIVMFTQSKDLLNSPKVESGYKVISVEDLRWKRRDIKTVQLLYPSMAKTWAVKAGVDDAWLVEDGFVTEGTANNAYIVRQDGVVITRHLSNAILHGITRQTLLEYSKGVGLTVEQRPFTIKEAIEASEAFITGASIFVAPVVEIDGKTIGTGKPGPICRSIRELYIENALKYAI